MANNNYTLMTNQELVESVKRLNINEMKLNVMLRKHHFGLYEEIVRRTAYLTGDFYKHGVVPMLARIYCLVHGVVEHPKCNNPNCTNNVMWRSDLQSFATYCSRKCQYGDAEHWNKIRRGCFNHYGVDNPGLAPEVQSKMKATCMEKYGTEYAIASSIVQEHVRSSCRRLFGVDYPLQSQEIMEKTRDRCEELYGDRCMFNTQHIREKTNEQFGCGWYTQSHEYHKNKRHKFRSEKYPELTFDSTWEVKVYEFCKDNDIPVEYSPAISYPYEYDGRTFYYHPDFIINRKVYEVKGDYFFRMNETTGQEEMFYPYRDEDWSNDYYAWKCRQYEAKHQCMIANDVVILRSRDIQNMSVSTFGVGVQL